ncbi:conserved hypothetical protein [Gluconacetobacter diazotrophicus PA1 5]|uniref:YkuD domain-containing protein n=2 Tax=Gluconacetobacter diazotrophicus TaxID=33996 RepID=A9HFH4_GLUDA|nr:conserved hypothetical protein [Gluconacetobacter diazotrophicus PA1 5]
MGREQRSAGNARRIASSGAFETASEGGRMRAVYSMVGTTIAGGVILAAALSACAASPVPAPPAAAPATIVAPAEDNPAIDIPPLPALDDDAARAEAARLATLMRRDIPHFQPLSPADEARWIGLARAQMAQSDVVVDRAQLLMVVDRSPRVQRVCFVLALPGTAPWQVLGGTRVSTGRTGRKFNYVTPTGVFINSPDRLGYRAQGTRNENGIRGIGVRGMRVWDMGWQWAEKGWLPSREKGQIRLEIHATDPDFLESRLGHPASEGCVRIPSALNVFMDRHGLLDVLYEQAASYDGRFRALLPRDRVPSPIAGDALVVVDSSFSEEKEAKRL